MDNLHATYEAIGRAVSDAILTANGITVHGSVSMVYETVGKHVVDALFDVQ